MARKVTIARDANAAASATGRIDEASLIGMRVGERYRLLELIGQGGMGGVFRAEQTPSQRIVALKLLHPELANIEYVARRFEREARAASRLSHPNIVEILDFGESNGHLYIAMELLVGKSLTDIIAGDELPTGDATVAGRVRDMLVRRRPNRVTQAIAIMHQVLNALAHAHEQGVVHRDIKPDNIMLLPPTDATSLAHVKLLDFGIAKLADDAPAGSKLTQAGVPLGTPHYMSPEQAAGDASDVRTDLYSCGVILYELLTGRLPFDAPTVVQILSMQVTATPEPPRSVAPQARIPEALESIVLRALAKRPEDRFASAAEMRDALDRVAPSGIEPGIAMPAHRPWLNLAARTALIAVGAFALIDHHWPSRERRAHAKPVAAPSSAAAEDGPAPRRTMIGATPKRPRHRER